MGYHVEIHYRLLKKSLPLPVLPYSLKPMRLFVEEGIWMFIHLNIVLFFRILFTKSDIFWANDLDTLLPNILSARFKSKPVIYDSHELYTEGPSLVNRHFKKRIWEWVERLCIPRVTAMVTVNDAIKDFYEKKYHRAVHVIRNVPPIEKSRNIVAADLGLHGRKVIIIQGAGLHKSRGVEELVLAMQFLDRSFCLIVAGTGDALPLLKVYANDYDLQEKILFLDVVPYAQLISYTKSADLGIVPEKVGASPASNYTLPNKLFDYIHSGLPVLSTSAVEVEKIIRLYNIGCIINEHSPANIAESIRSVFNDRETLDRWKTNTKFAAAELCWEKEQVILIDLLQQVENGAVKKNKERVQYKSANN
jgi:glycosyltransferase involved in cell wall biosynthesis